MKWEKQIRYAQINPDLTQEIREELINSLTYLKNLLGKSFLKTCGVQHPIAQKIYNKAFWQIKELIEFANTVKSLDQPDSNFDKLKKKLISPVDYSNEGKYFVEIGGMLNSSGFTIEFLDESNYKKTPDLLAIDSSSGSKIYVEVSRLGQSDRNEQMRYNYHNLFEQFHFRPPYLNFSCIQLKFIEDKSMPTLIQKIKTLKQSVYNNENFQLLKDEYIDLALAHPKCQEQLENWIHENNRQYDLKGLSLDFDDTGRILSNNKILDKASQIPSCYPGIIYIPITLPFFFFQTNFDQAVELVQSQLNPHPNILGVVFYSELGMSIEKSFSVEKDGNFLGVNRLQEDRIRYLFFISNYKFAMSLDSGAKNQIYNSFKF